MTWFRLLETWLRLTSSQGKKTILPSSMGTPAPSIWSASSTWLTQLTTSSRCPEINHLFLTRPCTRLYSLRRDSSSMEFRDFLEVLMPPFPVMTRSKAWRPRILLFNIKNLTWPILTWKSLLSLKSTQLLTKKIQLVTCSKLRWLSLMTLRFNMDMLFSWLSCSLKSLEKPLTTGRNTRKKIFNSASYQMWSKSPWSVLLSRSVPRSSSKLLKRTLET
jgi:hypothetical protein